MISVGDCELVILRRVNGRRKPLEAIFHTEMQRIGGNAQSPLQIARVDDEIDPAFDESIALEVIQKGSAVHCVSAYQGDILVLGSDGVFDNMFLEDIAQICNRMLPPANSTTAPDDLDTRLLRQVAQCIVEAAHAKTEADA